MIRSKDPFLWLESSGATARAWHMDCKLAALEKERGLCECGCGHPAPIATRNWKSAGHVKGYPARFIHGHKNKDRQTTRYLEEDRGFETPCWVWQMYVNHTTGYARETFEGKTRNVHRANWEAIHGPLPRGQHLHHMCEVRHCVNPDHLQVLSASAHAKFHHAKKEAA